MGYHISRLLYLLLRNLHLRLLDLGFYLLACLLGKVVVQIEPFRLLRGQLGTGLFDLHD
jgi:hypothetical protein